MSRDRDLREHEEFIEQLLGEVLDLRAENERLRAQQTPARVVDLNARRSGQKGTQ